MWLPPLGSHPIQMDILNQDELTKLGNNFNCVLVDPPWHVATSSPTRGTTISYSTLCDKDIGSIKLNLLGKNALFCIWAPVSKFQFVIEWGTRCGLRFRDVLTWVKLTNSGRKATMMGPILLRCTEFCLIFETLDPPETMIRGCALNLVEEGRGIQSEKPYEVYGVLERMFGENGRFLELFARKNNLRKGWVSVGNEFNELKVTEETKYV